MRSVFTVVFLCVCALPAPASAEWVSARSDHFHVIGDGGAGQARDILRRFEQFREVVRQLNPALLREGEAPPVVILAFRNARSFEPFLPQANGRNIPVAGYFQPGEDVNYIALNLDSGEDAYATLFHEYSHVLLRGVFADAPLWLNEGLAEYYSTFALTNGGRRAHIGRAVARHINLLRERRLPFDRFFTVDRNSPAYTRDTTDRDVLYAQAWAVVHHAFHGVPRRRDQLLNFALKLASGGATEPSFREAFGMPLADLQREVQNYVQNHVYESAYFDFPESIVTRYAAAEVTRVDDVEADAYLADLLAHMGRDADAEARLQEVLRKKPDIALAHAALGRLRLRQGDTAAAMTHLERAVAHGSADETVHFAYAHAALTGGNGEKTRMPAAVAALERALQLRPGYSAARDLLAYAHLTAGAFAKARELLLPVVKAEPGNHGAALNLAMALLQLDDLNGARGVLGPVLARATDERHRTRARELLGYSARMQTRRDTAAAAGLATDTPRNAPAPATASESPKGQSPDASAPRNGDAPGVFVPVFRRIAAGEQRVYGVFQSVECQADGVVLAVRTSQQLIRARAARFSDVEFISYRKDAPASIPCGEQPSPMAVYFTMRTGNGDSPMAVAIELLPREFVP